MSTRLTLQGRSKRPNWTIRTVNGKPFPVLPQSLVHEHYIVDRDSFEDTNGNLQRTILGAKDKFILTFPAMKGSDHDKIMQMVQGNYLTVVFEDYFDPKITRKATFYHGDLKKSPYQIKNGRYIYDAGTNFSLIAYNTYRR